MRLVEVRLDFHRSVEDLVFSAGPLTVLFGKNNAGKTNVLETIYGALAPDDRNAIRRTPSERPSRPTAVVLVDLEVGIPFDDAVAEAVQRAGGTQPRRAAFANDGVFAGDDFEEDGTDDVDPREWLDDAPGAPRLHPLLLDWSYSDVHTRVHGAAGKSVFSAFDCCALASMVGASAGREPTCEYADLRVQGRLIDGSPELVHELTSNRTARALTSCGAAGRDRSCTRGYRAGLNGHGACARRLSAAATVPPTASTPSFPSLPCPGLRCPRCHGQGALDGAKAIGRFEVVARPAEAVQVPGPQVLERVAVTVSQGGELLGSLVTLLSPISRDGARLHVGELTPSVELLSIALDRVGIGIGWRLRALQGDGHLGLLV